MPSHYETRNTHLLCKFQYQSYPETTRSLGVCMFMCRKAFFLIALTTLSWSVFAAQDAHIQCVAVQDTDNQAIIKLLNGNNTLISNFSPSQYALVRYLCSLADDSEVDKVKVEVKSRASTNCSSSSTLCVQTKSGVFNSNNALTLEKGATDELFILFRNPNRRQTSIVDAGSGQIEWESQDNNVDAKFGPLDISGLKTGINLGGEVKDSYCQVYISGAQGLYPTAICSSPGCIPQSAVTVANGKLIFQAGVIGASGDMSIPQKVEWGSGPDKFGVWRAAPVNQEIIVRAKVTVKDGTVNECAVKFTQLGKGHNLRVNKYGDCAYFKDSRDYYFRNANNDGVQTGPYPSPLKLPGFDANYGSKGPDMPFRGVLNAAADLSGNVTVANSQVVIPAPGNRRYSQAVVVALSLDPKTRVVGQPAYYGILDPGNYQNTLLRPIAEEPPDDALLVFQFFLAAPEMTAGIDRRGTTGGTPFYTLKESSNGQPFDRLVPVVNDSCMPVFQVKTPARPDKKMPVTMADATTCAFSKPFRAADVRAGRASLSVIHFTAESPADLFPLDLIKADNSGGSSSGSGGSGGQCWVIYPSFGSASWVSGSGSATQARSTEDECSMTKVSQGTMGFRYSMEAMRWGLGLSNQVDSSKVGKIVYRDDAQMAGGGTWGWLLTMFYGNPRNLTTNSTLSSATSGIRNQNFAVRQWGQPVADIMTDKTGQMGETDNLVVSFTAPICPGSQFQYDNVSLSWSPLILDIEGKGIKISRQFTRSVGFDIRGTGYKSYVDWPENTKDVAFLVLPDKNGDVKSIHQLFGYQEKIENGFVKLAEFDKNKDGRIDEKDAVFKLLRLWFDRNRDGIQQKGELASLDESGVSLISLAYTRAGQDMSAEQRTLNGLYYNKVKKAMLNIEDHYFYEYVDSKRVKVETKNAGNPKKPS